MVLKQLTAFEQLQLRLTSRDAFALVNGYRQTAEWQYEQYIQAIQAFGTLEDGKR